MWKVLLLFVAVGCVADDVTDGTTLLQAFLIHRHGDRTPNADMMYLSSDPDTYEKVVAKYGYGQLTELGKQRGYKLGQSIAKRYSSLLSPQFNESEIYLRSTDVTRTKMTLLTALAAIFPAPVDNWSDSINWTPVPYTTVPLQDDYVLGSRNCPTALVKFSEAYSEDQPSMEKYSDLINELVNITGIEKLKKSPALTFDLHEVYVSQEHLGVPLGKRLESLMPRLTEAAGTSMSIFLDSDQSKLISGVLLNEFFNYSSIIGAGNSTPSVRIYSAHDTNVFSFMATCKVPSQGVPPYGASFALEFRKVNATGQFVVLPVYQSSPCAEKQYLQVEGCELLCDYKKFQELVADFLLDVQTRIKNCNDDD